MASPPPAVGGGAEGRLEDGRVGDVAHQTGVTGTELVHRGLDRDVEVDADDDGTVAGEPGGDGLAEPPCGARDDDAVRTRCGVGSLRCVHRGQLRHRPPPRAFCDGNTITEFLTMMRLD